MINSSKPLTRTQINAARAIAIVADAVQVGLFPIFAEGFFSPLDDALDLVVGLLLCWLVGFHIAFIPAFVVEALPFVDEAPTWTIAAFIATHGRKVIT